MSQRRHLILIVLAALAFTAAASAAKPVNKKVWAKAKTAWTVQARSHGAIAECDDWRNGTLTCKFGDAGRVSIYGRPARCLYYVQVNYPAPAFPRMQTVDLNYCAKRWWTKPLPAPWSLPQR